MICRLSYLYTYRQMQRMTLVCWWYQYRLKNELCIDVTSGHLWHHLWHRCLVWEADWHRDDSRYLTYWGRVTHICVSKLTTICSDNDLSPGRRQAIIWTSFKILLIGPTATNFSEILIKILTLTFKKCIWMCSMRNSGLFYNWNQNSKSFSQESNVLKMMVISELDVHAG